MKEEIVQVVDTKKNISLSSIKEEIIIVKKNINELKNDLKNLKKSIKKYKKQEEISKFIEIKNNLMKKMNDLHILQIKKQEITYEKYMTDKKNKSMKLISMHNSMKKKLEEKELKQLKKYENQIKKEKLKHGMFIQNLQKYDLFLRNLNEKNTLVNKKMPKILEWFDK